MTKNSFQRFLYWKNTEAYFLMGKVCFKELIIVKNKVTNFYVGELLVIVL